MSTVATAIRSTRGALRTVDAAKAWTVSSREAAGSLHNRSLVYYNGAFSPPTLAHAHIVGAIAKQNGVECLWVDPEPARPKKAQWLDETFDARVEMCERMLSELGLEGMGGVGTLRKDLGPELGSTIELFNTLRTLLGGHGKGRLVWALGADVLDNMKYWADKARTFLQPGVTCDGLLVFVRDGWTEEKLIASATTVFGRAPAADELVILQMPEDLAAASSHKARKALVRKTEDIDEETSSSPLMLPGIKKLCMNMPAVLETYEDQVRNTPRATPTNSGTKDPETPRETLDLNDELADGFGEKDPKS